MATPCRFVLVDLRAAVALAAMAVASCTAASSSDSLQQVRASNPSVTYEYTDDEGLLRAQQEAVLFCSQYQAAARPARLASSSTSGSKNVVFECDPNLPTTVRVVSGTDLAYSYRTDQELLAASRNANTYCTDNGWRQAVPSIRTNTDGSRTVVFTCA